LRSTIHPRHPSSTLRRACVGNALINKYPRAAAGKRRIRNFINYNTTQAPQLLAYTHKLTTIYYPHTANRRTTPLLIFTRLFALAHVIVYTNTRRHYIIIMYGLVASVYLHGIYIKLQLQRVCVVIGGGVYLKVVELWPLTDFLPAAVEKDERDKYFTRASAYVCVYRGEIYLPKNDDGAATDGRQRRHRKCVVSYVTGMYSSCHTHTRGTRRVYLDIFNPPPP